MMEKIMIFGGTGSLGQTITEMFLGKTEQIIIYSRSEFTQWNLKQKINSEKIEYVLGDVFNKTKVKKAIKKYDPTLIIVASAMKHVDRCEKEIKNCLETNVFGLLNIIESIEELTDEISLQKLIMVSTDKACSPINVYGMSKSICEHIVQNYSIIKNKYNEQIILSCVRYGNVINSQGSIIPLLQKQAEDPNVKYFTLTSPDMTRFYMKLEESVKLIEDCILYGKHGEIWIPKLTSMKILDLMTIFSKKYGKSIKTVGIRPGEKIHESLISKEEVFRTTEKNNRYVILPEGKINENDLIIFSENEYSSKDNVLTIEQLENRLFPSSDEKQPLIIVLGSTGMLGSYVYQYFCEYRYKVVRPVFRITKENISSITKRFENIKESFVIVINCIGRINKPEATWEEYQLLNSEFPKIMYNFCLEHDWKYIHVSTDCVFSGKRGSYSEADCTDSDTRYGKSKINGEVGMVLRCSIIGKEKREQKKGLYEVICNSGRFFGYTNNYWNGITTLEYAKILRFLIENNMYWTGVRHIAPNYVVSKHELAQYIKNINGINLELIPYESPVPSNKTLVSIYKNIVPIAELQTQLVELRDYILRAKTLVVIISCLNPPNSPLCYSSTRSIYTPDERLQQTIETVHSVREKIPWAEIYWCEVSNLTVSQIEIIKDLGVFLIEGLLIPNVLEQVNSPYKGATEMIVMKNLLSVLQTENFYEKVFKISGRYVLNNDFNDLNFSDTLPTFRCFNEHGTVSTVLWSVGKQYFSAMIKDLDETIKHTYNNSTSVERYLGKTFSTIHHIDVLGVEGYVSVDGTFSKH